LEDELFIPLVFPYRKRADPPWVLRCITWGGGLAMLFPPADVVAIPAQPHFGPIPLGKTTLRFVDYDKFVGALGEFARPENGMLRITVDGAHRAANQLKRLRSSPADEFERIGYDRFVDVY
jgi:hypothetical protein